MVGMMRVGVRVSPFKIGQQRPHCLTSISHDGNIDAVVRADRVGLVVDLNHLRREAEQTTVASRPHIQAGADAHDHVGLRDQLKGGRRSEAA